MKRDDPRRKDLRSVMQRARIDVRRAMRRTKLEAWMITSVTDSGAEPPPEGKKRMFGLWLYDRAWNWAIAEVMLGEKYGPL